MFLVLVIALALLGVGYALWSETLTITGTVQTGEVDVEFSQYPAEECIDIQGVLTCPEPPEKAAAANCTVAWSNTATDPNDNGANLLEVTVTGMYPSYHCKVGFDVTSTGNVPVHVWLPEPAGDIPAWVATNFENCYDDGVQLHQGESTGKCTVDIHFTNDTAPEENSGPYTFGWTILATQFNEDPVTGPIVTPGYSNLTEAAGVRYRGVSTGNEIYIGIPDLGVAGNRVEIPYPDVYTPWADGTYVVTFSFDQAENKITTSINGPMGAASTEYDFDTLLSPGCPTASWNTMDINVVDRLTTGELAYNNVMLNGFSLGNFDSEGWNNWTVSGFDFSQSFTVSGDMVVQGWTGSETNKLQLIVGCLP
jgi:predicted ribosomally synthesized peptide with SipW-like signal peptide